MQSKKIILTEYLKKQSQPNLKIKFNKHTYLKAGDSFLIRVLTSKFVLIKKYTALLIITLLIAISLTGCWGHNELKDLNLVTVLGIDSAPNDEIKVTVLVSAPSGNIISQEDTADTWIGTVTGINLAEALKNLNKISNKKLVWYHTRIIVVGAAAAEKGLFELADFAARSQELQLRSRILITEGDAGDLLSTPADVLPDLPQELEGLIKSTEGWSKSYIPKLKDLLISLLSEENSDMIIGKISYDLSKRKTYSINKEKTRREASKDEPLGVIYLEGSAVIKKGKLVGFLTGTETRGCMWVTNQTHEGVIPLNIDNQNIVIDYKFDDVSIKPEFKNEKISMKVKLTISGALSEMTADKDLLKLPTVKEVESLWQDQVISEISSAIYKLQTEYSADVLGFANMIKKKYPKEWKQIQQNWDEEFSNIIMDYDVIVIFRGYGNSIFPITQKQ